MKKFLFAILLASTLVTFFEPNQASAKAITSSGPIVLDEENLKRNAVKRLITTIKQQNPTATGLEELTTENIKIANKEPIHFDGNTFWMVKIKFESLPGVQEQDTPAMEMTMTVDPTGTYQFGDINHIETSASMLSRARRVLSKTEIADDLGSLLFKGKGKAKALFVSDPYCSFCRDQYKYLKEIKDKFASIRLLHSPVHQLHPTAPITCAVLAYAKDKLSNEQYLRVVDFAYTNMEERVRPNGSRAGTATTLEQEMEVVRRFTDQFPPLLKGQEFDSLFYFIKGKYLEVINQESAIATGQFGLRGTPNTFIDGYLVRGFNRAEIEEILSESSQ